MHLTPISKNAFYHLFDIMNILSCIGAAVAAAVFAAPVCAFCTSVGFSGVAALAGAALLVSLIPTGGI